MKRQELIDLNVFLTVAAERNFTRAAAKLGTSQSALSNSMRRLESRLGLRLLNRTTRSVAPTDAGERLLRTLGPALSRVGAELASLNRFSETPAGTIRITSSEHAAEDILWPALAEFLPRYPQIKVEVCIENAFTDIVNEHFDAGVRLGEQVAKDMIAVPIGPPVRMAVVGAPAYLAKHPAPKKPQDLIDHKCINMRLRTSGEIYAWEFAKRAHELQVRVVGQFVLNRLSLALAAALEGVGLAYIPEARGRAQLSDGHLVRVLGDWCPSFPGYHIYYPRRRQPAPAFALLLDALRYRDRSDVSRDS